MADTYKLKYLTRGKLRTFLAAADRIIPADGDSPGGGTMQTAGVVDWAMDRLDPGLRSQLLLLLTVVELMGFLFGLRPFSKCGDKAKDRQLRWMESSSIGLMRIGFFGLKSYACMGYYTREDAWKTIDYAGPLIPDQPFPDHVIRALCKGELEVVQ